jgi:hypothetical protein
MFRVMSLFSGKKQVLRLAVYAVKDREQEYLKDTISKVFGL